MTTYLLERALLPDGVHDDVEVRVEDGRFAEVRVQNRRLGAEAMNPKRQFPRISGETTRVPGLTIPGLANCHSHAFHRALRGRTQRERGSFWTWRDQMYGVAERLDPDSYFALARAAYREMVASGITCVGEFHYLHHQPDGRAYADPNAMGEALLAAAAEAGLRITLLDTLYLSSGFGRPPAGAQVRYTDGHVDAWAERVSALAERPGARIGAALHSVRAVPAEAMPTVAAWAAARQAPLHAHLSEQVAENDACVAEYGATPAQLLADHDVLGPRTTLVHATHLSEDDVAHLGSTRSYGCFCPTTERDLGDGIGPSRRLHDAGARLTLGSDSHAVVDLFEEMRAVELHERLATQRRGHWQAAELLEAATGTGHASLGWSDAGAIAVGRRADLVTLNQASIRTAGTGADENTVVFAATAADVTQVMVDGRLRHVADDLPGIGRELDAAIGRLQP